MALTQGERLRQLLGEVVNAGEAAEDTLFTNEEISDLLDQSDNDLERAAYEGWRAKAAKLANLVDTTEGNSSKKFSQLHASSLEMVKLYGRSSGGNTEGRARVGRIRRPGVEWS